MEERGEEKQLKAEHHVINPKSITMWQLYGQVWGRCMDRNHFEGFKLLVDRCAFNTHIRAV